MSILALVVFSLAGCSEDDCLKVCHDDHESCLEDCLEDLDCEDECGSDADCATTCED